MLKVIIEKEIREILGSPKFVLTFSVCAILLIAAFYVGGVRYQVYQRQYEASKSESLRKLDGQTDWLNVEGTRVFLPPQPLSTLVSGVSNDIGRTGDIAGGSEIEISDSRFNEDPIFAIFRFLDVEFVFTLLLSLFAILMGYDAVSGEKEQGTLRLTFANPVPRHTYILGKLIGSMATLSFSVLLTSAIGCLLLPILGVPMTGVDWFKLAMVIGAGLLYLGVFLSLSLFVSSLTHRSSNSFLLLLVVWIGAVMIIPRASVVLAGRAVEVPSVDSISAQKSAYAHQLREEFIDNLGGYDMPSGGNMEEIMGAFQSFMDSISEIRESKMKALNDRLYEDRSNRQVVQEGVAFNLARFSPTTSLTLAATELAGTSLLLKNEFKRQAYDYQTAYQNFIEEKTGINPHGGMRMRMVRETDGETVQPEYIDPTEMPQFEYQTASLGESLSSAVVDLGLLAVYNLLFFVSTLMAFIRYDVR